MLFLFNRDLPGVLGRIATFIGDNNVNIGRLYLGRKKVGESALALIQIDQPMTEESPERTGGVARCDFREAEHAVIDTSIASRTASTIDSRDKLGTSGFLFIACS